MSSLNATPSDEPVEPPLQATSQFLAESPQYVDSSLKSTSHSNAAPLVSSYKLFNKNFTTLMKYNNSANLIDINMAVSSTEISSGIMEPPDVATFGDKKKLNDLLAAASLSTSDPKTAEHSTQPISDSNKSKSKSTYSSSSSTSSNSSSCSSSTHSQNEAAPPTTPTTPALASNTTTLFSLSTSSNSMASRNTLLLSNNKNFHHAQSKSAASVKATPTTPLNKPALGKDPYN